MLFTLILQGQERPLYATSHATKTFQTCFALDDKRIRFIFFLCTLPLKPKVTANWEFMHLR